MPSYVALRQARCLSTTATAAAAAAASTISASAGEKISLTQAKARLSSQYDPDKALEIYSSVSDHYSTPLGSRYVQHLTVKRLQKAKRFSDIETLIEAHKNDPQITQEPYLSTLIRSYGRAGMFEQALNTYNQMDELGTPRSTISFNALLSACNVSKRLEQVPKLFDEIPQRHCFSPDKVSYGILVKSYCESGSVELAMDTLKSMEEKGIEITAITYTTILDALYKNGMREEGDKLWNDMIKKGCFPDVAAYSVRMMNVQGDDPENVLGLIDEMRNVGLKPDTMTYNYLIHAYCRSKKIEEAMKVYEELRGNGCKPNVVTFKYLIFYLCKKGEFEAGYKLFKESVKLRKVSPLTTLKPLVEGLVKNSKNKEAKDLIFMAKKMFPASKLSDWKKVEEELDLGSGAVSLDSEGTKKRQLHQIFGRRNLGN